MKRYLVKVIIYCDNPNFARGKGRRDIETYIHVDDKVSLDDLEKKMRKYMLCFP